MGDVAHRHSTRWGVVNVLTEEGGKVWAAVGEFGLVSGLRAVGTSLLSVRGADRDVKGSVGVPRAEVRKSAGRMSVLGRCVYQRSDRVVLALHKGRVRKAYRSPGAGGTYFWTPSRRRDVRSDAQDESLPTIFLGENLD